MKFLQNIVFIGAILACLVACNKDFYADSASDVLSFSCDTVSFDTVFTQKGSITQTVKIINNRKGTIKIDKIALAGGDESQFIINVNGTSGREICNVDVARGDSIIVFVQTKLREQESDTVQPNFDRLLVNYNGIQSHVVLAAWGQNVFDHRNEVLETTTFSAQKPHVIYDSLVIPQGKTLTIEAGAKVYLHYGANIIVQGSLKVQGTIEKPVTFSSDRLEQTYQLLPGQWGSIIFQPSSQNNVINFAEIKNGINGLVFYADSENSVDCLISNSIIENMTGNAIVSQNAHIESFNCIFANCDFRILDIQGGWFSSIHNTISNNGSAKGRKFFPSVSIADVSTETANFMVQQATFQNTIIVGSAINEIEISAKNGDNSMPCLFQNCLLRDTYTKVDSVYYKDVTFLDSKQSLFANSQFALDTLSQARNIGLLSVAQLHPTDKMNRSRTQDSKPDVGALEYFYEPKTEK